MDARVTQTRVPYTQTNIHNIMTRDDAVGWSGEMEIWEIGQVKSLATLTTFNSNLDHHITVHSHHVYMTYKPEIVKKKEFYIYIRCQHVLSW